MGTLNRSAARCLASSTALFEKEKKRFPTTEEITDNIEDTISLDLIQAVLTDIECKYKDIKYNQDPTYASSGSEV